MISPEAIVCSSGLAKHLRMKAQQVRASPCIELINLNRQIAFRAYNSAAATVSIAGTAQDDPQSHSSVLEILHSMVQRQLAIYTRRDAYALRPRETALTVRDQLEEMERDRRIPFEGLFEKSCSQYLIVLYAF